MLKYRLPSGIFLGAVVLTSIFLKGDSGRYVFLCFGSFLAFAAVVEFLGMLDEMGMKSFPRLTAFIAALVLALLVLRLPSLAYVSLGTAVVVLSWLFLLNPENRVESISRIVHSLSALPLLLFPLSFMVLLYNSEGGRLFFFYMILITKLGDVGAYTFGTISAKVMPGGNHKIIPKISPKKSWEGTLGGMLTSVVASFAFCYYAPDIVIADLGPIPFPLAAGVLLFIGGFIGDLVESALKRAAGVKDSGNMIPGMGGALDVVDSLVLNSPLFYLFLAALS
jgi:phosphatidate cytidylyltransferase